MLAPSPKVSTAVVVVSSFYTAAFETSFAAALARRQQTASVICVPYNQLHTFLLDPRPHIPADAAAQVVLLLRVEDLIRFELAALGKDMALDHSTCARVFRERTEQFLDVLKRVSGMRMLVLLCPAGRGAYDLQFLGNYARVAEHKIAAALRSQQRHVVVTWPEFEKTAQPRNVFNVAGDRLGHVPFTPEGLDAVAEFLVTQLQRLPSEQLAAPKTGGAGLDLRQFLDSLGVQISAAPMTAEDEQPVLDLVRHTTHFINLSNRKWDRENLRTLADGHPAQETWTLRVQDRFGDYGISGAIIFSVDSGVMRTGLLFLTCPVLGKQVEHAWLSWVTEVAQEHHAHRIEVPFVKGRDNEVLYAFLNKLSGDRDNTPLPLGAEKTFHLQVAGLTDRIVSEAPNPAALTRVRSHAQAA